MSYCVNCGVELEQSLKDCPLCNTPVINPNELIDLTQKPPFATEKGDVEVVKRKDLAILISTILLSTAVTCGFLNWLILTSVPWSVTIIGACVVLWVIMIPIFINTKQSIYLSLMLDGVAVLIYLYLLTWITHENGWFYGLGIQITLATMVILELCVLCMRLLPKSFLTRALYVITSIGLLCIGYEFYIDKYLYTEVQFSWSAIVLVVCVIVDIAIITMLSRRRLRNAVRRRLHF